jgi:hypothetical protein
LNIDCCDAATGRRKLSNADNLEFDPKRKFAQFWYWYSRQIRVPTLWGAAAIVRRFGYHSTLFA